MIRIIAIGFLAAATTLNAHIYTFTTRLDKKEFGFHEPIEVTSELRISSNPLGPDYLEEISSNVVYEVESVVRGTFLPIKSNVCGGESGRYFGWEDKRENVNTDNASLIVAMDLRKLFPFEVGRYRVRGKYRSDPRSSTFEKLSQWSEFEIRPQTESEIIALQDLEFTGMGKTKAEQLTSYEAFAAKYPMDYCTVRVYSEILDIYLKTGQEAAALEFLKRVINSPIVSKLKRRLYAYEIANLEEKSGRVDEAIRWYRQTGLRLGEEHADKLEVKAALN